MDKVRGRERMRRERMTREKAKVSAQRVRTLARIGGDNGVIVSARQLAEMHEMAREVMRELAVAHSCIGADNAHFVQKHVGEARSIMRAVLGLMDERVSETLDTLGILGTIVPANGAA